MKTTTLIIESCLHKVSNEENYCSHLRKHHICSLGTKRLHFALSILRLVNPDKFILKAC